LISVKRASASAPKRKGRPLRATIPRTIPEISSCWKGSIRAIQVMVAFAITRKQKKYLEWWSRRSPHSQGIIRKLSSRVFELPPNAFSLYLISRLIRNIGSEFVDAYPVGFSSDIPQISKGIIKEIFVNQRLRDSETARLKRLSLRVY